jgi:hypothetical protein
VVVKYQNLKGIYYIYQSLMVNYRPVQFSHTLFWGFQRMVDLDEVESLQDIIDIMYIKLVEFLKGENFEVLLEKLEKTKNVLHIHNNTFGQILISKPTNIIYICDHGDTCND